jgi:hypothetical protein
MKIKKSIQLLATTAASSLIVSMTTGCGADEKPQSIQKQQSSEEDSDATPSNRKPINLKIKNAEGSVDTGRCIGAGRCVIQDN